MFRVLDTNTNTHQYFSHIVYAYKYCMKTNGKIDNNLEALHNKYVVVTNDMKICNTLEEAMKLKDDYIPHMCAVNVAKIDEGPHLDWHSYTNPLYDTTDE